MPASGWRLLQVYVRLLRVCRVAATASKSTTSIETTTIDTPLASAAVYSAAVATVASAVAPSAIASAIVATQRTTSVTARNASRILADAIVRVVRRTWMAKA